MKKSWLTWLGLGAACAVCCAPLVAGAMGAGAAGVGFSLFGLGLADTLCVTAIVGALAALGVFLLARRRVSRKAAEECECAPSSDSAQCEVGGACAPVERGATAPQRSYDLQQKPCVRPAPEAHGSPLSNDKALRPDTYRTRSRAGGVRV